MRHLAIDDTDRVMPHVRLAHMILREGLDKAHRTFLFLPPSDTRPLGTAQSGEAAQPEIGLPPAPYEAVVSYLKGMAGIDEHDGAAGGTVLLSLGGRHTSIGIVTRRDEHGQVELELLFPVARVPPAT